MPTPSTIIEENARRVLSEGDDSLFGDFFPRCFLCLQDLDPEGVMFVTCPKCNQITWLTGAHYTQDKAYGDR